MRSTPHSPHNSIGSESQLRLTTEGLIWLLVLVLLGVIGWWKSLSLLLLLAYSMAMLLILNGILARVQVRRVQAKQLDEGSSPVFAGEDVVVRIQLHNVGSGPACVGVANSDSGPQGGWFVDRISSSEEVGWSDCRQYPRRGRYPVTNPTVWSGFPFGFLRCERPGLQTGEIVVLPALGNADPDGLRRWVIRQAGDDGRSRRVLRRVISDQADVRGIRPYRPGDSIRWVHWRSTARRGELLVREYDAAPTPDLVVVVEPWLPPNPTPRDYSRLEAALSLATTVAYTWSQDLGTRVTVVIPGAMPATASPVTAAESTREALSPLADLAGTHTTLPVHPELFSRVATKAARVLITSRPGSPILGALNGASERSFVVLDPTMSLPWYQAPQSAEPRE